MSIIFKICGIKTIATLEILHGLSVDWFGLVHHEASPRHISALDAKKLCDYNQNKLQSVLLLVDKPWYIALDLLNEIKPNFVQFHGHESPEYCLTIKKNWRGKIIKAWGIAKHDDFNACQGYEDIIDYCLFDAKPNIQDSRNGGLGRSFPWELTKYYQGKLPWVLAGGLKPDNILQACEIAQPFGVDVSSGVEVNGEKSSDLITQFVNNGRKYSDLTNR